MKSVSTKVMAGYANPSVTKINIAAKTIGKKVVVGDDKHVVNDSFPYVQDGNSIHFFGFDKGGGRIIGDLAINAPARRS